MTGSSSSFGRWFSNIEGRLFVLIFACVSAGIVAAGYFYYRAYEKHYRSDVERQLSAIAVLKVGDLVQWRKERMADANMFFRNAAFSSLVGHEEQGDAEARQQLQTWVEKFQTANGYAMASLIDAEGATQTSSPADPAPLSSTLSRRISEVLRSGQFAFQDFYRDEHDKRVYLAILIPILNESDAGHPLGVLVLRIDPATYLYPLIQRWPTPSSTAETLLVRREGNEVAFLNELRFQKNTALTLRATLDRAMMPAAQAASGKEGIIDGIDYRGVQVVAALDSIPDSPWFLVTRIDTAEAYAPMRKELRMIAGLMGALLLGAGACVGLVWRQQRVRYYRAKYEAEEDRAKLAAIVESSDDAIISKSLDGTVMSWNAGAERLLGYKASEMIGQPIDRIIPADSLSWEKEVMKLMRHGGRVEHYEGVRIANDGRHIDVSLTISPILDAAGTVIGAAKIARDITVRKQLELTLRDSEERFRTMVNAMPQLAWIARADGFIDWYNRRWYEYTGTKPGQMEGWGWQIVLDSAVLPKVMENWTEAIASGTSFEMSFPLRGADAQFRTFLTRVEPLKDSEGRVVQWFGTNTDVEMLMQAEEKIRLLNNELEQRVTERTAELEAANKELEAFSYSVSHDLRTPLRAMNGFSMALMEDYAGKLDETAQDHLRRIRAGSQLMAELIDDLLNLSQVGRAEMRRESVNLTEMAEEIGTEFQRLQPERHVKFAVAPALVVDADKRMLRVVLNNLLANAWKFTSRQEQALIEVGARDQDGQRVFFVRDNGAGFDMAYAGRLFGAFQRLHSAHEFEGTGIGLALVQRIIHRHGGRVWAMGAVGQGATVFFALGKERD